MSGDDIVVAGVGMMTSVGLTAPETAASVRASIARVTAMPWSDARGEPFSFAEVIEAGLPPLDPALARGTASRREARMLRLGAAPLRECLAASSAAAVPLCLALPEPDKASPIDRQAFLSLFHTQTDGAFDRAKSRADFEGRAGGLKALEAAALALRRGEEPLVVAGGIDSYREFQLFDRLSAARRLKSSFNLDGFIPGEGAGFVLLARREEAEARGLAPLASLVALGAGFEAGHLYSDEPYLGEGLAATVRAVLDAAALSEPVREVYSSMNGENHWAKEWGVAYVRNRAGFDPEHSMHHPADCFGDTGAAAGALLAGLAALGLTAGYRGAPALVYASSDSGARAALTLNAA